MGLLKEIFHKTGTNYSRECRQTLASGYHVSWHAIKGESLLSVIEKLGLRIIWEFDSKSGLKQAEEYGDRVFVKAVQSDYILVVGLVSVGPQLEKHCKLFSELQYFDICAIYNDAACWRKYVQGKLVRSYYYEGAYGVEDEGEMTKEEVDLGFSKFWKSADYDETWDVEEWDYYHETAIFPYGNDVIDIAKAWGTDPSFEEDDAQGRGYVCKVPWKLF